MELQKPYGGNVFLFKVEDGRKTFFMYQLSDLSALYQQSDQERKARANNRQARKYLVQNELNEFCLTVKSGESFYIGEPILTRERSKEDVEKYCKLQDDCPFKGEVAKVELEIVLPPGSSIKVYSVFERYQMYIVNEDEISKLKRLK